MRRDFPAWILAILYAATCFLFQSPLQHLLGLLAALALFLSATTIGHYILRIPPLRTSLDTSQDDHSYIAFPLGLGILLLVVYAIGSLNASPIVTRTIWILLAFLSFGSIRELKQPVPLYCLWGAPFFALTIWSTFTPSTFYDALAYNLGIPYQYMAYERISTFSTWTTSFFPPFDQIAKFLFLSIAPQNSIKLFSLLLFLHILRMLCAAKPQNIDERYIVIPLLLLPVPWVLIHIVNPDLLNAFFFVASICALVRKNILLSAMLLAFNCWTKYTTYPFLIFIPLLLWPGSQNLTTFLKRGALFLFVFVLLMTPLYVRNIYLKGDPLYPLLNSVLPSDWTPAQTAAVQKEFPTPRDAMEFGKRALLTPFLATFGLRSYGSASEIGILPLVGLLFLFLHLRKLNLWLAAFVFFCYLIWIQQLYHFRYFLPVYFVAAWLFAYSFQWIAQISRKIVLALWIAGAIGALYVSVPPFRLFPLIPPAQESHEYLNKLSYYAAAEMLNRSKTAQRTIMVGETRNAYITSKLVPFSYTDPDPLLKWSWGARDDGELYKKMKDESVSFILYNPAEMNRLTKQYGIWKASPEVSHRVRDLLQKHGKVLFSKNGVVLIRIQ